MEILVSIKQSANKTISVSNIWNLLTQGKEMINIEYNW